MDDLSDIVKKRKFAMKKDSIFCHSFIYKNAYRKDDNGYYWISSYGMHEVEEKKNNFLPVLTRTLSNFMKGSAI